MRYTDDDLRANFPSTSPVRRRAAIRGLAEVYAKELFDNPDIAFVLVQIIEDVLCLNSIEEVEREADTFCFPWGKSVHVAFDPYPDPDCDSCDCDSCNSDRSVFSR